MTERTDRLQEALRCAQLAADAKPIPEGVYVCRCDHPHHPDAHWCYVCEYPIDRGLARQRPAFPTDGPGPSTPTANPGDRTA